MRDIRLSETAERQLAALSQSDRARYYEVSIMLSEFLLPLRRSRLVHESTLYGQTYLVFHDHRFPYLIYFEVVSDDETELESILIRQILRGSY